MKRKLLCLLIAVLLLTIIFSGCFEEKTPAKEYDVYVNADGTADYVSIQDAINNSSFGDCIFVYEGTYYESLIIDKGLTIIGEDRNLTIIDGFGNDRVIDITADKVTICSFTIQNSGWGSLNSAIFIQSNECLIQENILQNNEVCGIIIGAYSNSTISKNIIRYNGDGGIYLGNSNNITIVDNILFNNTKHGIWLHHAKHCVINENSIKNHTWNGIYLQDASHNIIYKNFISNANEGGIVLGWEFNEYDASDDNLIFENTIDDNRYGISIYANSTSNKVYKNNIIGNVINAFDNFNNTWDNGEIGNYWSDYVEKYPNALQVNNYLVGLLWDTPYNIPGGNNQDLYPLINPVNIDYETFTVYEKHKAEPYNITVYYVSIPLDQSEAITVYETIRGWKLMNSPLSSSEKTDEGWKIRDFRCLPIGGDGVWTMIINEDNRTVNITYYFCI